MAEADRCVVADPQRLQGGRLAAGGRRRGGGVAINRRGRARLPGRLAARLAAVPALAGRRLGAADDRRVRHRGGARAQSVAGRGPGPGQRLGQRLGPAGRPRHPPRRAAGRPGRRPGRARYRRGAVGVADLRHHHRPGRAHRLRTDRVRRPAMAPAGTRRTRPGRRPRLGSVADPARPDRDRRDHPHRPAPMAAHPDRPVPLVRPAFGDRRLLGQRQDQPDDAAVGRLVRRRDHCPPAPRRGPAAAGGARLQGRPGRPRQSRTHPPPAARRRRPPGGHSGPTTRGCAYGTCHPATSACCCR